jgi:predicted RNA polymerase sigma factor
VNELPKRKNWAERRKNAVATMRYLCYNNGYNEDIMGFHTIYQGGGCI